MAGKRICVIGAGPSGLSVLIQFKNLAKEGATLPEIVCYEKQDNWGGLWNFTWRTGVDEHGLPVHGSMYRHLWSNGPKECLEFGDYTFDDHFKKPITSFPPRTALFDYLQGRWNKYNLRDKVTFNHSVKWVTYDDVTKQFSVVVHDHVVDKIRTEIFDYVIVCGGHFSCPNVPDFPGISEFPGRVIHSHDYRDATQFKGQRLLVVGGSYSAEDIALQTMKFGARHVTISTRSIAMGFHWPANIVEKPGIKQISKSTVTFQDNTSDDYDCIILCTGYWMDNRFMDEPLRLKGFNPMYPDDPCYQAVVWLNAAVGRLFYIAYHDQYYTFTLFDAQAFYVAKVILGLVSLPSKGEMDADAKKWKKRADALKDCHEHIDFQTDQLEEVKKIAGYPYKVDCAKELHDWEHHKHESIVGYRDKVFRSIHTGTLASTPSQTWMQIMSDDMEKYLKL